MKILKTFKDGRINFLEKCEPMNGHDTRKVTVFIGDKILLDKSLSDASEQKLNSALREAGVNNNCWTTGWSTPQPLTMFAKKVELADRLLIIETGSGSKYHVMNNSDGFNYYEYSPDTFRVWTDEEIALEVGRRTTEKIEREIRADKAKTSFNERMKSKEGVMLEWYETKVAKYEGAKSTVGELFNGTSGATLKRFASNNAANGINISKRDMKLFLKKMGYETRDAMLDNHYDGLAIIIYGDVRSGNYGT